MTEEPQHPSTATEWVQWPPGGCHQGHQAGATKGLGNPRCCQAARHQLCPQTHLEKGCSQGSLLEERAPVGVAGEQSPSPRARALRRLSLPSQAPPALTRTGHSTQLSLAIMHSCSPWNYAR